MSYPNSRDLCTFCRDLTNVENYAFSVEIFYPEIIGRVNFLTNLKSEDEEFSFVWRKKKLECLGMAPFAVHHLKLHESD